ncbi:hypothetical protein L798_01237 [Zootermopsis nevadensis]|uniref:Uncharacterized protein n=1 Tax=Zootermopsis nevadensis TaxID=136037 RepID=A0A067QIL1_ZOONE|nr:hypothetical protein L798_01237 [Zootermopsis nevadensis]
MYFPGSASRLQHFWFIVVKKVDQSIMPYQIHHMFTSHEIGGSAEVLADSCHCQISALWCNIAEAREAFLVSQSTPLFPCGENKEPLDFQFQSCAESSACPAILI